MSSIYDIKFDEYYVNQEGYVFGARKLTTYTNAIAIDDTMLLYLLTQIYPYEKPGWEYVDYYLNNKDLETLKLVKIDKEIAESLYIVKSLDSNDSRKGNNINNG